MKKSILLISILLQCVNTFSQSPNWLWAQSAGEFSDEAGNSITTDSSGNAIVTGFFENTISFGIITLISNGGSDVFVVKYDKFGNVLWAKNAGGSSDDWGMAVATDNDGNIIVTGFYMSTGITFGSTILTNAGGQDVFIVKYDPAGNVLWANLAGGNSSDVGHSVVADSSGNIFITGAFSSSTLTFGLTSITLLNSGGTDLFVAKYNRSGTLIWTKSEGGSLDDYSSSIASDDNGNFLITGYFNSPTLTFGTTNLINSGSNNIFVVKYDTSGNAVWAESAGGIGASFPTGNDIDLGNSIATDQQGNILVSGLFYGSSLVFGTTTLTSPVGKSVYLVKYDNSGNILWAKSFNTALNSIFYHNCIVTDHNSNIFMTGSFESGTLMFDTNSLSNSGAGDIYIAKFDSSGNALWAKGVGGTGFAYEQANSVAIDKDGSVFVTGQFESSNISFGSSTLTNAGNYDVFVGKLDNTINGIEGLNSLNELFIYPNPANSYFLIECKDYHKKIAITLLDITGKIVYSEESLEGENIKVNVKDFKEGFYVLQIYISDFVRNQKIIISK